MEPDWRWGWGRHGRPLVVTKKPYLPKLSTACWCCDLETCCKVQGWFALVWSALAVSGSVYDILYNNWLSAPDCRASLETRPWLECMDERENEYVYMAMISLLIVLYVFTFILAISFLKGIRVKRPVLMELYIHILLVHVVFNIAVVILTTIITNRGVQFVTLHLAIGLPYYMAVCAHSLQFKMANRADDSCLSVAVAPPAPPGAVTALIDPPPFYPPGRGYGPPGVESAPSAPAL